MASLADFLGNQLIDIFAGSATGESFIEDVYDYAELKHGENPEYEHYFPEENVKDTYAHFERQHGNPLQYINKWGYLSGAIGRAAFGGGFDREKEVYLELSEKLSSGANTGELMDLFLKYENEFNILTPEGENIAKDMFNKPWDYGEDAGHWKPPQQNNNP